MSRRDTMLDRDTTVSRSSARRNASRRSRLLLITTAAALALIAAASRPGDLAAPISTTKSFATDSSAGASEATGPGGAPTSGLPASTSLEPALYDPDDHRVVEVVPTGLRIEALGITSAPVRPVGISDDDTMEIPPASEVGWYRHAATPAQPEGTTVLAAHVTYNGVDGVFRNLATLQAGAVVDVALEDGREVSYRVERVDLYDKQELPDDLFATTGSSRLVLITCGGEFDDERRSFASNVVVHAMRVDDA